MAQELFLPRTEMLGLGKVMSEVTGQIDMKPTILSLLGIEAEDDLYFGNDVFADERKGYIALRNGDFISDDYISTYGMCYDRETGEPIEEDSEELDATGEEKAQSSTENACSPITEKVETELSYSDNLIYGDLFRFIDFGDKEAASN